MSLTSVDQKEWPNRKAWKDSCYKVTEALKMVISNIFNWFMPKNGTSLKIDPQKRVVVNKPTGVHKLFINLPPQGKDRQHSKNTQDPRANPRTDHETI